MNDTSDAQAVCTTLLRLVDKLLKRYPTSLKDDAAALHRDRPMPHRYAKHRAVCPSLFNSAL